jgi:hypothetical protein
MLFEMTTCCVDQYDVDFHDSYVLLTRSPHVSPVTFSIQSVVNLNDTLLKYFSQFVVYVLLGSAGINN